MNRDSVIYHSNELLKSLPRDHTLYNDILDILSLFYNYKDDEIMEYSQAKYKIIQNKKIEAINILDSIKNDNPLLKMENVIITPHLATKAIESQKNAYENSLKNASKVINGNIADSIVKPV